MSTFQAQKTRRPKIGASSNGMLMTPEEYDAITDYDDRFHYELIHGVLIVSPFASPSECDPNEELGYLLRLYRDTHADGSALDQTLFDYYINLKDSRRRADRAIWAGLGRVPDLEKDVPTIVIEFVAKSTRDRIRDYEEKRREYLDLGIKESWVIDRYARTMTVFRRPDSGAEEAVVKVEATYRTPLLPGFELPLARLLTLADKWAKRQKKSLTTWFVNRARLIRVFVRSSPSKSFRSRA